MSDGQLVVDEIVVATGCRPNLEILRELRLSLDLSIEAAKELGPLIDANHHSCGSVPSHAVAELSCPESGFCMVGMEGYLVRRRFFVVRDMSKFVLSRQNCPGPMPSRARSNSDSLKREFAPRIGLLLERQMRSFAAECTRL